MQIGLRQIPLIKFATPFFIGLLLPIPWGMLIFWLLAFCLFLFCLNLILSKFRVNAVAAHIIWSLLLYSFIVLSAGILQSSGSYAIPYNQQSDYLLIIDEKPELTKSQLSVKANVIRDLKNNVPCDFGVLLTIYESEGSASWKIGDRCLLRANLDEIEGPNYDFEFDFRSYYHAQSVLAKAIIAEQQLRLVSRPSFHLRRALELLKKKLQEQISRSYDSQHARLLQALLLGDRSQLDSRVKRNFINSGSIHVLAVSGLHVGVVYALALTLLSKLLNRRTATALTLILVWLYAFITGLAPPVERASIMLTLFALSGMLQRKYNALNAVVFTLLLAAIWKPNILDSLSAQFSFAAVFGILLGYPLFRRYLKSGDWLLDQLCSMVALTCAAQLLTLPLCLHYFGQFPLHFILANITVVPLMVLVFHLGLIWIALVSFVPGLASLLSKLIGIYVQTALDLNTELGSWDQCIAIVNCSVGQMTMLVIVIFTTLVAHKNRVVLVIALCCSAAGQISSLRSASNKTVVFSWHSDKVVLIKHSSNALIVGNSKALLDAGFWQYKMEPFLRKNQINYAQRVPLEMLSRNWQIGDIKCFGKGKVVGPNLWVLFCIEMNRKYSFQKSDMNHMEINEIFLQGKEEIMQCEVKKLKGTLVIEM